ncbi:TET3B-like protein [Mya arenaria]|uniref:Methylcytosine dioxygenase TET n=1 Tax=Mya arenaria TaxID=6604 RepID=A0ABY7DH18_MYAAR|nr:TET3B-like protein [Mya arenaria]
MACIQYPIEGEVIHSLHETGEVWGPGSSGVCRRDPGISHCQALEVTADVASLNILAIPEMKPDTLEELNKLVAAVRTSLHARRAENSKCIQRTFSGDDRTWKHPGDIENVSSQGSMQGAAPPYIPGWAGFSGHDVYQQGVPGFQPSLSMAALAPPSALQPPGAMSGLGNLPHRMPSPWHPHLPSVNSLPVNGLQSVLPDVNGYALEKELRAASGARINDVSSSSLKWKSVYMPNTNSSVENYTHSREPMSYRDPGQMSTSTSLSLPVVTSAAPQHSNVISYYSEPRDRDRYSIPAGFPSEMASREAAKILAESHVSDMTLRPQQASENRHRTSPFMNISNNVHRQHNAPPFEEIFQKLPSKLGMPNDMRPENAPQYSSLPPPSKASQSKVPDFWSQFGLPQPFMDQNGLNLQPQGAENAHVKRQYEHEHQEESLPKPSKKQKVKNLPEITHPDSSGPVLQMSDGKCKSPKSDNRRGIFAPNPEIDALVNAKVCEIMAAIKQKEKPVPTDSCETRKSPKQEKKAQSSAHSNHPTFVHAPHGETNYPANGKSVDIDPYKFPQSDEHARLSNQVMDMRMNRKGVMLENPQTSSSSRSFEPGNAHAQHGSSSIQSVVDYSIEAMICKTGEKPAPHPQPSKHEQLMHQVNEVRQIKQDHGRVSPCCGNCEQLGVQSSEHCTNHKHLQLKENMQMATHLQQKGNLQMATHLQQQKGNKQMATHLQQKGNLQMASHKHENKTACRDRVSPKALENISHEFLEVKNQAKNEMEMKEVKPLTAMPFHRSRSFECLASDIDVSEKRFRSNSIDLGSPQKTNNKQHACQQQQSLPLVQGGLNNQAPQSCDLSQMEAISSQISDLRERVTGGNQNLEQNLVEEVPRCSCLASDSMINEAVEGPYYTHLGSGRSVEAIRVILENRTGVYGSAVRIEKLRYSGKEGKSPQGCPIAKWIVRRGSVEEKYLALVRHRVGHVCDKAWIIIGLVAWEGVPATQADHLYDYLSTTLPSYGNETERRCGTNDRKTCACQGADLMKRGASFSFGCSWSMYFNGCKFARSTHARKFRLKNESAEQLLEDKLQELASQVGPLYKQCAPDAHANQSHFSKMAQDCRLGDSGPFSGVTACVDFCAHAHKDIHNMNNGSTVVVTLTKHRGLSKPDDEQLHVLPMYVLDPTDERGSFEGQFAKIQNGSLEVLHQFPLEARMRAQPLESCKKRKMAKKGAGKRMTKNGIYGWDSSSSAQSTPQKSMDMMSNQSGASHSGSLDNTPVKNAASDLDLKSDKPVSYEDLMAMSQHTQFNALYDKFWDYFYAFGVFPPPSILAQCIDKAAPSIQRSAKLPFTSHAQLNGGMADPYRVTSEQQKFDQQHAVPLHSNIAASSQGQHQSIPQLNKPVKVENMYGDHRANGQYVENCNNKAVHPSFGSNARIGDIHQPNDSGNIVENLSSHGTIPETISLTKEHKSNQPPARGIPTENGALDLSFSSNSSKSSQPALHNEQNLHEHSLLNKHASGNEHPTSSYQSPLDMLSQAVDMRSKNVGFNGTLTYTNGSNSQENHPPPSGYFYQSHHEAAYQNGRSSAFNKNQEQNQPFNHLFAEKNSGNQEFSNTQRLENTGQHNPSAFPSHHQGFSEQVSMGPGQPNMGPHSFNPQKLACGENLAPTLGPQPEQREPSLIDPDVVKCEMEYNEAAFRDPEMGGVAIALCHGAVLFEVAKRELHATTGLRNPNRYHPTRISLVFYQHKNLNTERHGMYAYEKKLEQLKMKRIEKMQLERGYVDMREIEDSFKGGKKRKVNSEEAKEEEELAQLVQQSQAPYRYMWDCSTARAETSTSAVTSTRWVEPCPMVTGPYQKWA